jgi:hypothetical protein
MIDGELAGRGRGSRESAETGDAPEVENARKTLQSLFGIVRVDREGKATPTFRSACLQTW